MNTSFKAQPASCLISLCFVLFGCGQQQEDMVSAAPSLPASHTPSKQASAPPTRLQQALEEFHELSHEHEPTRRPRATSERIADRERWLLNVLNQGYAASSHTNIAWAASAHDSFAGYAAYTRGTNGGAHYSALTNALVKALAQGCDDPMIRYMQLRYGLSHSNYTRETFALASVAVFRSMLASQYHPLLKFMAGLRAAEAAFAAEPEGDRAPANGVVTAALEDLARDTNAPATDVFECTSLWIRFGCGFRWREYVTARVEGIIKETRGDDARFFELRGVAEVARAWNARGGDFADKVTTQGWKDFTTHLNQAALALETAWQMDPTNALTAYYMMQVELGQGQGRARMEKWFHRAMNLAPDYYDAAQLMSFYLEPRWYGSEETALQFARSCVSSTNFTGTVPLVLANLHRSLAGYYKATGGPDHWNGAGVWKDVRSSYEKYFQLNPKNYGYRHEYARDAYECGQYSEFLAQTRLFAGGTNFAFFGGEAKFNQMLQRAALVKAGAK